MTSWLAVAAVVHRDCHAAHFAANPASAMKKLDVLLWLAIGWFVTLCITTVWMMGSFW
jgi:hypothetical protein